MPAVLSVRTQHPEMDLKTGTTVTEPDQLSSRFSGQEGSARAPTQVITGIHSGFPELQSTRLYRGFSILELLIGMALSTLLISAVILLLSSSVSIYRMQLSQSHLEESSRYATDVLTTHISQAGFQPDPWLEQPEFPALTDDTVDGLSLTGDQLGTQRWSQKNCYGNDNPVRDFNDLPVFYLLQSKFRVTSSGNLGFTCRYGADASTSRLQINNFGLVGGIESLQVLYAEDRDADGIADNWVTAQHWQNETDIRAVKVAMLLASDQKFDQPSIGRFTLLDQTVERPSDGHLRRVSTFTSAIRGRLK